MPAPFIGTRFTIELTDELDFEFWDTTLAESSDAVTIPADACGAFHLPPAANKTAPTFK